MRLNLRIGHDASASISHRGVVKFAIAEERMSRIKNDSQFPIKSIKKCFEYLNIKNEDITELFITSRNYPKKLLDYIALTGELERALEIHASKNFSNLARVKKALNPSSKINWFKSDIRFDAHIKLEEVKSVIFCDHHLSHAASVLQTTPFLNKKKHGVLVIDGIGDGTSISLWSQQQSEIKCLKRWGRAFSLGWFYGIATEAFGWVHGTDEWKLMGMAAYGGETAGYNGLEHYCPSPSLIDSKAHAVNFPNFTIHTDNGRNIYRNQLAERIAEFDPHSNEKGYASKVQQVVEQSFAQLILEIKNHYEFDYLSMSGGFFLNVKNNQKLHEKSLFKGIHISPDSGDSGLIHGTALVESNVESGCHSNPNDSAKLYPRSVVMSPYLGTGYTSNEIEQLLNDRKLTYKVVRQPEETAASLLHDDKLIGWFQGRMEVGARALGNRSILANPTNPKNKDRVNQAIKYREGFRPFCPSLLEEDAERFLENWYDNEHMTCSFKANELASHKIPAVVHIDGTCRIQIVKPFNNEIYHNLIKCFKQKSGVGVVLNTSFNIKGEPIVENPRQAIKCFFDTGLDALILDNFLIEKDG